MRLDAEINQEHPAKIGRFTNAKTHFLVPNKHILGFTQMAKVEIGPTSMAGMLKIHFDKKNTSVLLHRSTTSIFSTKKCLIFQ